MLPLPVVNGQVTLPVKTSPVLTTTAKLSPTSKVPSPKFIFTPSPKRTTPFSVRNGPNFRAGSVPRYQVNRAVPASPATEIRTWKVFVAAVPVYEPQYSASPVPTLPPGTVSNTVLVRIPVVKASSSSSSPER